MDFDKLKTFYYVVRKDSVTEAANELKLGKSSISRQITLLEEQLNCQLFNRQSNKLVLTPSGELLFERAKTLLNEVEALQSSLNADEEDLVGNFRVTSTHALISTWISLFLHLFLEQHPLLRMDLIATNQKLDLSFRDAEVAIRPYVANTEGMIQNFLLRWHLNLFASQSYLDQFGVPKSVDDLDHHRMIVYVDSTALYPESYTHWPLYMKTKFGRERKPYMMTNSLQGMYHLVRNGMGIGAFAMGSPLLSEGELIPVLTDEMAMDIDIYYIYPEQYSGVKKVLAFEEFIKNQISSEKR